MNIRNSLLFSFFLLISVGLSAQSFVTLDWNNPSPIYEGDSLIVTKMPGFAGAGHLSSDYIPYYFEQFDLGTEYGSYDYNVKIEYPEYQPLSDKDIKEIKNSGAVLHSSPMVNTSLYSPSKRGLLDVNFVPIIYKDGTYLRINSFKLTLVKTPSARKASKREEKESRYAANSVLASGKWVKIRVREAGVYQFTHSDLSKMGFSNPSKVRLYGYGGRILHEDFNKERIDDLQEVPLWRENDYVLFYAYGTVRWEVSNNIHVQTQNPYSVYSYYFLTESDGIPLPFLKETSLPDANAATVTSFPDYALEEKEEFNWFQRGRKFYENYDYKYGDTRSYNLKATGITEGPASITVAFSTNSTTIKDISSVAIQLNGVSQGELSVANWSSSEKKYVEPYLLGMNTVDTYEWKGDKTENVIVALKHIRNQGISGHLDYIRLNYTRKLALNGSFTSFRSNQSGTLKFIVDGVNDNTRIWNVTNPKAFKQIEGNLSGQQYSFVTNNSVENEYVAVNVKGTFSKPEVVGTIENQNLHALSSQDMVIIIPASGLFREQAEQLAKAHREMDELKVIVVDAGQIYNEFSSGTPDATAYRWFMKMLFDKASSDEIPKYLLLFGDGTYDNRMLTTNWNKLKSDDFLLTYQSVNSRSETISYVCEDYYGFLNDNSHKSVHEYGKVDIAIGRFPVRTISQAKQLVDKIIAYMENKEVGNWKNKVCILGDDGKKDDSSKNIHMDQADQIAKKIENTGLGYMVKRILWDAYKMEKTSTGNTYPEVTKQILESFDKGMLLFNYVGHGGPGDLSDEHCLITKHLSQIHSTKAPIWMTAACSVAPFDAYDESLGEAALLHAKGAAIAVYSTTRTVFVSQNHTMNQAFTGYLFSKEDGKYLRLGDIIRKTKVYMSTGSRADINNLNYVFLGDPALKLSYPDYQLVIDEFNSQQTDDTSIIKAGEVVTVKGHVQTSDGEIDEDYNGFVYPVVFDSKEDVECYNNNGLASSKFKFQDRNKILFSGSDTIKNGKFSFTFPVSLDIHYSNKSGLLNLYSYNNDKQKEAQGEFTNFLIGGSGDDIDGDGEGPAIKLYLNNPDFVSGGKVNETPYLVVELEDEDGINTVGNGIGHDLMVMIDNSPIYTYILNNYYEAYPGDYRKGTVGYSIPELPDGKHQLFFRAWDTKNNSSSVTLDFEVVKGLQPGLFGLDYVMQDPDHATFIFEHDRPATELDIRLVVCDFSGRELWIHQEKGVSSDNFYYINWDLTTSGGQKVVPGVYLFQTTVTSNGTKESSKANKIVVLGK